MYCVELEKPIDRVPRKVLKLATRKKGIPKVLLRTEKSLYEGVKTRVRVDSELSDVKVRIYQASVSPYLFAVVVDVVTELTLVSVLSQ